jgi:hypothetical protein
VVSGRDRLEARSPDKELLSFGWASVVIKQTRRWSCGLALAGLSMKSAERCNSENNIARTEHARRRGRYDLAVAGGVSIVRPLTRSGTVKARLLYWRGNHERPIRRKAARLLNDWDSAGTRSPFDAYRKRKSPGPHKPKKLTRREVFWVAIIVIVLTLPGFIGLPYTPTR